jgi:4-amino-4-deoxy-L-arabinose transferase-like glycosyltransferase
VRQQSRQVALVAVASSVCAFVLYAVLAARDVMFGDGPELTAAAVTNGVAHPPGYPLWVMLGHVASLVPLGTIPFRVNLTACVYHALAVGLVFLSGYVLTRRYATALFAAALLAIASPLFVTWSLQAEVFSLSDLFAAAAVLLSLLWLEDQNRWRLILPLGALFGLGLSHHQTLVLLAPLPLWAAWCGRNVLLKTKGVLATAALAALVLVLCFTLPYVHALAASQHLHGWFLGAAPDLPRLIDLIDRRAYGYFNLVPGAADRGGNPLSHSTVLIAAVGWPYVFVLCGIVGVAIRAQYRRMVFALLIVAAFLAFCTVASIDVAQEMDRAVFERFGLLPIVALAPFAACAIFVLEAVIRQVRVRTIVAAAFALAVFANAAVHLPSLSLADVHDARTLFTDVAHALPPNAILLTAGDAVDLPPLYFQAVEGWRPDVTIVTYGFLNSASYRTWLGQTLSVPLAVGMDIAPQSRRDLLVRANANRPFYVTGERPAHAPGPFSYARVDGVVSRMIPNQQKIDVRRHYAVESALQLTPGYADITADPARSNGFVWEVREYYAGGFFSTGYDAERLGDKPSAHAWYERAAAYSPDRLIRARLDRL